jgi:anti-sigma regulatory factor (Ser/Thr protein kinase)
VTTALRTALPPEPSSAGAARRFVVNALHRLGHEANSDVAELLVSELVTNAVLHARTSITVEITRRGEGIRVGIEDQSSRRPRQREYSDEAMTGRGLTLVEALATTWGTQATGTGKQIWFELHGEESSS